MKGMKANMTNNSSSQVNEKNSNKKNSKFQVESNFSQEIDNKNSSD